MILEVPTIFFTNLNRVTKFYRGNSKKVLIISPISEDMLWAYLRVITVPMLHRYILKVIQRSEYT